MDSNKVPTTTPTLLSAANNAPVPNPLFDPIAFQSAYFAAQLQNQLQQQQQTNPHLFAPTTTATATGSATITTTTAAANITSTNDLPSALPHKVTSPPSSSSTSRLLSPFLSNDRFCSLLPPQLQSCLQQQQRGLLLQQQQQQLNGPMMHHFSAFSPITMMDLPTSITSHTTSSQPSPPAPAPLPPPPPQQQQQQSLDLLLMQMQMATVAAAAGFLPAAAFGMLPPATAALGGLIAPHLRLPSQYVDSSNFPAYAAQLGLSPAVSMNGEMVMGKGSSVTTPMERSLLQAQMQLLANGSSATDAAMSEHACTSSSIGEMQQLNSTLNCHFSMNKQQQQKVQDERQQSQRVSSKRPCDEMSILRSLCNENYTAEEETVYNGKRSRMSNDAVVDENERRIRYKPTKEYSLGKNHQRMAPYNDRKLLVESAGSSKVERCVVEKTQAGGIFDENSPHRHHPLNHRPPAMEARFLECMAAIALHSNISLPIKNGEHTKHNKSAVGNKWEESGSAREPVTTNEAAATNPEVEEADKSSSEIELSSSSSDRLRSNEDITTKNENNSEKCSGKRWLNSAIDEELCQELENYKDSDVPVIHAFVLPPKLPDSTALGSDEKSSDESLFRTAPQSVAVPVPVLNILLDRILQTMLEP